MLESRIDEMRFWLQIHANNNGQQVNILLVTNECYDFNSRLLTVASLEHKIILLK